METSAQEAVWGAHETRYLKCSLKFLKKNIETWNPQWCYSLEQLIFW